MAEAARNHSDSKRTVDDLFQYLVRVCGNRPADAKMKILEKLQLDILQVDFHVRGGTQEILPLCTAEHADKLEDKEFTRVVMFHVYKFAPPEGITRRAPFQWWDAGSVLWLTIRDEHLIIEPNCLLDYPWDAYSFTIANWSLVGELWPNPNRARPALSAPASRSEGPAPLSAARRAPKVWVPYAIEQKHEELAGLRVQPASRLLGQWMKEGLYAPEKVVGWKRIKNIAIADKLLPIRAPGKRPKGAR